MKSRHAQAHMRAAFNYAQLSYAKRKQVGCLIVKDNTPIAIGWNGMAAGEDNCCEYTDDNGNLKTKPDVIHAEDNALRKLTRSHESAAGATAFVTLAPCTLCSTRMVDARIAKVYYCEEYPTSQPGIDYLRSHGVEVEQLALEE